jgi:hypothetical protein
MTFTLHKRLALAVFLLVALMLAGCGGKEPQQRQAFISFLQTRIIDRGGRAMPVPNEKEKQAFGPYAAHYQIILDFNRGMGAAMKSIDNANALQRKVGTVSGLMNNWQELVKLEQEWPNIDQALAAELKKAEDARAALKQPDDLKAIYGPIFDQFITTPAHGYQNMSPILIKTLKSKQELGRLLSENKDKIKISGSTAEFEDSALMSQVQAQQAIVQKNTTELMQAVRQITNPKK